MQPPVFHADQQWQNFHQTITQVQKGNWDLFFPRLGPGGATSIADLKETTRQMQSIIADAKTKGIPLRAVGSSWSLSRAPATTGWTINTNRLRGKLRILPADMHPLYPGTADQRAGLFLFQCGNTVADVNRTLEAPAQGRSLFTSGAANGQTIVGATSTGTHGSALECGALHDHIVAIHLVPTAAKHYWIERASRPVMSDAWVASLGADPKRDDDLFNAAVLSFGAFGFIESVVIETVPRYLLDARPGRAQLDENLWRVIGGLDFTAHSFFDGSGPPYFFQAIINPSSSEVLLNANYKIPCPANFQPTYGLDQDPTKIGPGFDSLSLAGFILDRFNWLIPRFSQVAASQLFDMNKKVGTSGMIYGYKPPQLKVGSGSIAVDLSQARPALEALIQLYRDIGPIPVVLGCRYVRKSPALLAFNKFNRGLMISIDGIDSQLTRAFYAAAPDRLESLGIKFTQHWGKTNHYTPERVSAAYGNRVDKWKDARRKVLPTIADRKLFDNEYITQRGLA